MCLRHVIARTDRRRDAHVGPHGIMARDERREEEALRRQDEDEADVEEARAARRLRRTDRRLLRQATARDARDARSVARSEHINLILSGTPETFVDPKGLLEGDGKTGRRLQLAPGDAIPTADVKAWLKAAAIRARD
jgi:hypothetical protein